MSELSPDETYRRQQAAEYGTYVASHPIDIRGARAFNVGDPVPVSHVETGTVSADDVTKVADEPKAPAGKRGTADPTGSET